jgi:ligand-binding sensor domain-containing protein
LFNIPVNAIAYQEGTEDRLFIGTDAGVYMSEKGSAWQKFGKLPNVRVTEMKINKSINKLRVATYGRGLWECTLPPSN